MSGAPPIAGTCPHCVRAVSLEVAPGRPTRECPHCKRRFEAHVPPRFVRARAQAAAPVVAKAVEAGAARCKAHPRNAAPSTCARCGDFICDICATPAEGQTLCVPCFERVVRSGAISAVQAEFRAPARSLSLGIFGLLFSIGCVGLPLGVAAIVVGAQALREIGEKPALPGRGKAIAGIILGAAAVLSTLGFVGFFVIQAARR